MSEWWTYRLSDFLLFSPRTYHRLFELYNKDIWPLQLVALAFGVAILGLLYRHDSWHGRAIAAILAVCWLWVAWAFHLERYATINWAATYLAAAFALQAMLLSWFGVVRDGLVFSFSSVRSGAGRIGLGIFLFALVVQPLIGPLLLERSWQQVELFGIAPDPTAVATVGLLLMSGRAAWPVMIVPVAWCVVGGATLWTMESPDAFVMPLLAAAGVVLAIWPRPARVSP